VTRIAWVAYNHVLAISKKVGVRKIKISTRKRFWEGKTPSCIEGLDSSDDPAWSLKT
jgi:translation initiation factor 1 (eIF-1/SUI1)